MALAPWLQYHALIQFRILVTWYNDAIHLLIECWSAKKIALDLLKDRDGFEALKDAEKALKELKNGIHGGLSAIGNLVLGCYSITIEAGANQIPARLSVTARNFTIVRILPDGRSSSLFTRCYSGRLL